jgi:hypothetical protein
MIPGETEEAITQIQANMARTKCNGSPRVSIEARRGVSWFRPLKTNVIRPGMGPTRFTQTHEWCLTCATSYKNYG